MPHVVVVGAGFAGHAAGRAAKGATVLINSPYKPDEVWDQIPREAQQQIVDKGLKVHVIDASHVVADLAEVVRGAPVRRSPQDVTLFKGVGMAFEDLVVARAALDAIG